MNSRPGRTGRDDKAENKLSLECYARTDATVIWRCSNSYHKTALTAYLRRAQAIMGPQLAQYPMNVVLDRLLGKI